MGGRVYRRIFTAQHFRIEFLTNSRSFLELVSKQLDFNRSTGRRLRTFKIQVWVQKPDFQGYGLGLHYPVGRESKSEWTGEVFAPVCRVSVNSKKKESTAFVFDADPEVHKHLLYITLFKPIRFLAAKERMYAVHASAVAKDDLLVVTHGPKNTGKSSFALELMAQGFGLISDDTVFLQKNRGQCRVFAFPTKMGIKRALKLRHPAIRGLLVKGYSYGEKQRASFVRGYRENLVDYNQKVVVFPRFKKSGPHKISSVSVKVALGRFLKENPNLNGRPKTPKNLKNVVDAYRSLLENARCFEVTYSDGNISGQIQNLLKLL